jgi:Domain of unknown function (DUF4287)
MSFQAYLNTIEIKTGRDVAALRDYAATKGWTESGSLKAGIKAGAIVADLKANLQLGHGHAMAVYALLSGKKREGDS